MDKTEILKHALIPGYTIGKVMENSINTFNKTAEKSTLVELKEESLREDIRSSVLQNQAKVEQELAIARRIDNAEEVEIEEYYDISGDGNLGINGDDKGLGLGINGSGRKVTKRVIKFKGSKTIIQTNED